MVSVTKDGVDGWIHYIDRYDTWCADKVDRMLDRLKKFLDASHDVLAKLETTSAITTQLPNVGQLITKVGRHPQLILEEGIYERLLRCILVLIPTNPLTPIEKRAAQWGQMLIRKSYSYFNQTSPCGRLAELVGYSTNDHHELAIEQLTKSVGRKLDELSRMSSNLTGEHCDQSSAVLLGDISHQMAPLVRFPACHPVVERLLLCNSALTRNALSERFLASLLELQARRFQYPKPELEADMSESTCVALWTSHLPALEHAVMSYIQTLSSRPYIGFHEAVNLLSSSHLPKACYCHSSLYYAVEQILRKLLFATEGSAVVLRVVYIFQYCYIRQRQFSSNKNHQYINVVPHRLRSLQSLLTVLPSDVKVTKRVDHLKNLCIFVGQLQADSVTMTTRLDLWLLVARHQHWYHQCLLGVFSEDSSLRVLCCQFVDWFHNTTATKDTLGAVEICSHCIQAGEVLTDDHKQYHMLYYQLLMAYAALFARKGGGCLDKILELVPDSELNRVVFLLEVLETFSNNIDDESRNVILVLLQQHHVGMTPQNGQNWTDITMRMDSQIKSLDNG